MDHLCDSDEDIYDGGDYDKPDKEYGCFNSNIIVRWFLTILFALFPKQKAVSYVKEGDEMREFIFFANIGHVFMFMFCFAYIGFISSAVNMGLMVWCFSLYMTLSTWKIMLYICAMCGYIGWTVVY